MTNSKPNRRGILAWTLAAVGLSATGRPVVAASLTPSATEGPFYPTKTMRRADVDNDLVKIMGKVQEAGGEVFHLKGRVLDKDGAPLEGLRIEIWQCDMNGKYLHPGDRQNIEFDAAFQGFGHDITGPDGAYAFRTIKPVTYPGRTPHIHIKLLDGATEILTSQFYIDGHPANDRDRIFRRLSPADAAAVSMVFVKADGESEANVDIMLRNA